MRRTLFVTGALSSLASGCVARGPEQPFTPLSYDSMPLRRQFDRDVDKVRVLMLVSPT
jgi:hypothetical protein